MQGMKMIRKMLGVLSAFLIGVSAFGQDASLDEALQKIAAYKFGDSREAMSVVNDLVRKADNAGGAERKDAEAKLLALLKANPSPDCVDFLCRQLAIIGTEATVPVLAPMLVKDEQSADWARYTLENIPAKEVDAALLDALTKTEGRARIGIINTLGVRKTADAVGPLAAMAGDSDAAIASAAIASLGLIGGDDATATVAKARAGALKSVADDAYIACANGFLADGKKDKATKIYTELSKAGESQRVRAAALVALAKAEPEKTQKELIALLKGEDEYLRAVAVGLLRDDAKASAQVLEALPGLSPEGQVLAIAVLEKHDAKSALGAVSQLVASENAEVQLSALHALGTLGNAETVPMLLTTATSGGDEAKRVASDSLDSLRGADVDAKMLAVMSGADAKIRGELIRSLAVRGATSALPALMSATDDADAAIQEKALDALGALAGPGELPALIDILAKKSGSPVQSRAEAAVIAVSQKVPQADARAATVLGALGASKDEKVRASLTNVLGRIGDASALGPLRELAAQTGEAAVQDAAVRALCDWETTATLDDLRAMAAKSANDAHRSLAFNGMIRIARMNEGGPDADTKVKVFEEALGLAKSADEKRLILAGLGNLKDERALALAKKLEADAEVEAEAKQAIEQITKSIAK